MLTALTLTTGFGSIAWLRSRDATQQWASNLWQQVTASDSADLTAMVNTKPLNVLSSYDRGLYEKIFVAMAAGDFRTVQALARRVHDRSLLGHVLYARYTNLRTDQLKYEDLRKWMQEYGDHPDAYKIYKLAQKNRGNSTAVLPAPQKQKKLFGSLEFNWLSYDVALPKTVKRNRAQARDVLAQIKTVIRQDRPTQALAFLDKPASVAALTPAEYDSARAKIAASYFFNNKPEAAYAAVVQSAQRSGQYVPYTNWIAGLSAWKLKDYPKAAKHFKAVLASKTRNPWVLSAAAFWASRAYAKMGDHSASEDWLFEAASYPRTFYGLIAQQKIGSETKFSWEPPALTESMIETLRNIPAGRRGLALVDVGQTHLAMREFAQINPHGNKRIEKALISAAHQFNMPDLALRLGNAINQPDGRLYDVALYPVVPWKGDTSTGVTPALVNALIRQESRFDPRAQNAQSGATGLMQLMPSTAQFIGDKSYSADDLRNPEVNIVLGQRYIRHLLNLPHVGGNMVFLAAAYNAGPANLARWQKRMDAADDPFLFIESIPVAETRAFVGRVLTNYWIYSHRLKQDKRTLDAMSQESWPLYNPKQRDAANDNMMRFASVERLYK